MMRAMPTNDASTYATTRAQSGSTHISAVAVANATALWPETNPRPVPELSRALISGRYSRGRPRSTMSLTTLARNHAATPLTTMARPRRQPYHQAAAIPITTGAQTVPSCMTGQRTPANQPGASLIHSVRSSSQSGGGSAAATASAGKNTAAAAPSRTNGARKPAGSGAWARVNGCSSESCPRRGPSPT